MSEPDQGYRTTVSIEEACIRLGVGQETVVEYIRHEWLVPTRQDPLQFDEQDLARAQFILDLRHSLGVNDEAIPVILHLVDQLHALRSLLKRSGS